MDTLETAQAFGLSTRPRVAEGDELDASVDFDPYRKRPIERLIGELDAAHSAPSTASTAAMGQPDLYPFVLSAPAIEKLGFVHNLVHPSQER